MAKRELIDSEKLLGDFQVGIPILQAIKNNTITEEEIVKPYLEKLNEHIINFPWKDRGGDFMTGVTAVYNLIDNLLTEKGTEE